MEPRPMDIRVGGSVRTLEEEEELQLALTILQINQRLRDRSGLGRAVLLRPLPGAKPRPETASR